jgi:hypothetical protein
LCGFIASIAFPVNSFLSFVFIFVLISQKRAWVLRYCENLPQKGFHSQEPFPAHLLSLPTLGNGKQEWISGYGIASKYGQWFVYFHGLFLFIG